MPALDEYWELWLRVTADEGIDPNEYERVAIRMSVLWHRMGPWELEQLRVKIDDWWLKRACELDKNPTWVNR